MENVYIGVDVGGMSIKAGLVNNNGKILHKGSKKTNSINGGKEALLKDIKDLMVEMIQYANDNDMKPLAIAFGIPGVVNNKLGTIDYACNLYVEDVPLKDYLKDLNLPVFLSNDANVAELLLTINFLKELKEKALNLAIPLLLLMGMSVLVEEEAALKPMLVLVHY